MKIKNKFYATDYNIASPYFNNSLQVKIMVASDIHYQTSVNCDLFNELVDYAKINKPDFIVMPGDQIETIDFIDNPSDKEFFENIIKSLGNISPVIMIPGNHEVRDCNRDNFKNRHEGTDDINTKALNYFKSLTKFENVYFLNNEQITIKGITFLGFNPRINSYVKINDIETENDFINDYLNCKFKVNENNYNILLTHGNLQLLSKRVVDSISDFSKIDLVISGHWHDGYLPKHLDKILGKTNVGLFFTPLKSPYPGIPCRNMHDFERGYMFISQGYRKWTADISLFNMLEKITANDIENIIISKKTKKEILNISQSKPLI